MFRVIKGLCCVESGQLVFRSIYINPLWKWFPGAVLSSILLWALKIWLSSKLSKFSGGQGRYLSVIHGFLPTPLFFLFRFSQTAINYLLLEPQLMSLSTLQQLPSGELSSLYILFWLWNNSEHFDKESISSLKRITCCWKRFS